MYTPTEFDEDLFMVSTTTTWITRIGKVMLKLTSNKVTLKNVMHVPTIRKSLVSDALLARG